MKTNSQSLFTLTPEEMRIVEFALYDSISCNNNDLAENGFAMSKELANSVRREIADKYNIVERIKQYQK